MIEELNFSPPESNICLTSSLVVLCSDANTFLEHSCTQHSLPGRSFVHLGMWLLFARTRVMSFLQAGQTRPPLETFSLAMYLHASTFFHCDGTSYILSVSITKTAGYLLVCLHEFLLQMKDIVCCCFGSVRWMSSFPFRHKLWICAMITFQLCLLSSFPYL